jgi:hypothetical protein
MWHAFACRLPLEQQGTFHVAYAGFDCDIGSHSSQAVFTAQLWHAFACRLPLEQQGTFHVAYAGFDCDICSHSSQAVFTVQLWHACMQVAFSNKAHFMMPMLALIVAFVHIQAKLYSQHSCGMLSHAGCLLSNKAHFMMPMLALIVTFVDNQAKLYFTAQLWHAFACRLHLATRHISCCLCWLACASLTKPSCVSQHSCGMLSHAGCI